MESLQAKVKAEYYITANTPIGRIDWAINDYMRTHELTQGEREELLNTSAMEVAEA